jgi:hypothetical protein
MRPGLHVFAAERIPALELWIPVCEFDHILVVHGRVR